MQDFLKHLKRQAAIIGSRSRRLTHNLLSKRFQFDHPFPSQISRSRFFFFFNLCLASQIWLSCLKYVPQGLCLAIKEIFRIEGLLEKRIVTKNSHFYILISLNLIEETGFITPQRTDSQKIAS